MYRWYQPNNPPFTQHLWLAPERNYHCVREEYQRGIRCTDAHARAARGGARDLVPGEDHGRRPAPRTGQGSDQAVVSRTETAVEQIELAPRHEAAFFRDVAIPADLPVFTIKDRKLVGSMLPEPFDDDWGRTEAGELAARVAEQENRHDDIEVRARAADEVSSLVRAPRTSATTRSSEQRSIVRGDLAYLESR